MQPQIRNPIYLIVVNLNSIWYAEIFDLEETCKMCVAAAQGNVCINYAKETQPGCKKVRGQSEATNISDQKL